MIKKLLAGKKLINVGMGEMKIALVTIFLMINGIINTSVQARGVVSNSRKNFEEHLICLSMGESADCTSIEELDITGPTIASVVFLSLMPVVALLVTCDLCACKKGNVRHQRMQHPQQASFLTS